METREVKVKIVRASDGAWVVGTVVDLDEFLTQVRWVLENGGEMPIAVLVS